MKYFFETRYIIETEPRNTLVSIGITSEDGRGFYAVNADCDYSKANEWELENVLAPMGLDREGIPRHLQHFQVWNKYRTTYGNVKPLEEIKQGVLRLLGADLEIEFWNYYAAYHHAPLVGMFPDLSIRLCNLREFAEEINYSGYSLEAPLHKDAWIDCRYTKAIYEFMKDYEECTRIVIRPKYLETTAI